MLLIRYNLNCTIRENRAGQYRIYITAKSKDNLIAIVLPHMHETMLYKLNIRHNKNPHWKKIFIDNIITGENLHYESISAAGTAADVCNTTIKKYLISGELLKNTYYIKGGESSENILQISKKVANISIRVTNIHTGESIEYSSIYAASQKLNIKRPRLKRYLISGNVLDNKYIIK